MLSLRRASAHRLQVYLGRWHETPVACKVLLRGSGDIKNAKEAQCALSIPTRVLAQLEEASCCASGQCNCAASLAAARHACPGEPSLPYCCCAAICRRRRCWPPCATRMS